MGIFSDMDFLGLGKFKDTNIIEDSKSKKATVEVEKKEIKLNESDYLFDKRYECPICDNNFVVKAVKANKLKIVSKDTDLRTVYEGVDPVKYEVITCGICGYSSLIRYYGKLSSTQMKRIREEVKGTFRGIDTNTQLVSYDDAIIKYKLALICSKVKMCKMSERAYTFLKLTWAYRGKRNEITAKPITEEFPKDVKHALIKELYVNELECIEQAFEGFDKAYSSESLPICGMDDNTFSYLMADLGRRLHKYNESMKFLERVIMSRGASQRIKDEAHKLKDMINQEMK